MREDARVPSIHLYGLRVSCFTFRETVDWILARAQDGQGGDVAALNAGKVVAMQRDPVLRQAMVQADLVIPDGQSIVWAARFFGHRIPERIAGIDTMMAACEAASANIPAFLLGARPDVLGRAVTALKARCPNLPIAGVRDGYFDEAEEPSIVDQIRQSGARLLFIGISSPKKELWMLRNAQAIPETVTMGVGGSFDILAGVTKRAPELVQRLGLEWSYRLVQEPRRMWRRYSVDNLAFLTLTAKLVRQYWSISSRSSGRHGG